MKILYYSAHPHLSLDNPTGYATHMKGVINAFRSLGHEVIPVIIGDIINPSSEVFHKAETNTNKQLSFLDKQRLKKIIPSIIWETIKDLELIKKDSKSYQILLDAIKKYSPDLIYERGYYLLTSGIDASSKMGIKHFVELNAPYPEERSYFSGKSLLKKMAEHAEKRQVMNSDRVIVVSSALKSYLLNKYPVNPQSVVVTPNAVNLEDIQTDNTTVSSLRNQFYLKDHLVIGFVGSIFPYHGVDLLLDAFSEIVSNHNVPLKLLIVGDGETLISLKKRAIELGLNDSVIFTGKVPHKDVFNYISLMDIAVMARSNWYGSPVKIFEYGAMGKAIIAPDNIPVRDVMVKDKDGILIDDNKESLKTAILFYLNNSEKRFEMANQFKVKVNERYTWFAIAEKILE